MMLLSVSAAVGSGSAAVGGTVDVIVNDAETRTDIGHGAELKTTEGDLKLDADYTGQIISVIASASASPSDSTTVAGSLGVMVDLTETTVNIDNATHVTASEGDVEIHANSDSVIGNGSLAVSGSRGGAAAGAVINVNVFDRDAKVNVHEFNAYAGRNIISQANAKDVTVIVSVAAAGTGSGSTALTGTIPVVVAKNEIENRWGDVTTASAKGSIVTDAHLSTRIYDVAGGVTVAASGNAVGAVISTAVLSNTVTNKIGAGSSLAAAAELDDGVELENGRTVKGVYVGADSSEVILLASLGVSGSGGTAAVAGVINTLVVGNEVTASANLTHLAAGYGDNANVLQENVSGAVGDVTVEALDDTFLANIGGAVAISSGNGVGATVPVVVFQKNVTADAKDAGILATGKATVNADTKDDIWDLGVTFALGGGIARAPGAEPAVSELVLSRGR